MKNLNKVMLTGRLGKDVELKAGASGKLFCHFSVASNRAVKDEDGNWTDHPEWFRVVAFGELAERCALLLTKGRLVFIEGRLQTREWQDEQQGRRFITEVIASEVLLLDRKPVAEGEEGEEGGNGSEMELQSGELATIQDIPF